MQLTGKWVYEDVNGNLIGVVKRFLDDDGKKSYLPCFKKDGDTFKSGIPDHLKEKRPLYGLGALKRLGSGNKTLYVVEGEKCAGALIDLGFGAISALGGSNAVNKSAWEALKSFEFHDIVIIPDNDDSGLKYAKAVYKRLKALCPIARFSIVEFPDLPIGGDICDFLTENYEELYSWDTIESLKDYPFKQAIIHGLQLNLNHFKKPIPIEWDAIESQNGLRAYSFGALNAMELPERECLLSPWLFQRSTNMVFADRGIGKTYFCLSCAVALCEGSSYLKYTATKSVRVLYLDGEMQASSMRDRLRDMAHDLSKVENNLLIVTPDCQHERDMPNLGKTDGLEEIDEIIEQFKPDVIFVDNLSTFIRSGNENEGESFLPVQDWSIRHRSAGRSVVFVHHTNKGGNQRGSSRKEDTMDIVIQLKRPEDYINGQEGARFEVHYTKHRNLFGDDIRPIEARLEEGKKWTWKSVESDFERAIDLYNDNMKQKDIAQTLGLNESTISKYIKRAKSEALI